jgi:hypothetical protein
VSITPLHPASEDERTLDITCDGCTVERRTCTEALLVAADPCRVHRDRDTRKSALLPGAGREQRVPLDGGSFAALRAHALTSVFVFSCPHFRLQTFFWRENSRHGWRSARVLREVKQGANNIRSYIYTLTAEQTGWLLLRPTSTDHKGLNPGGRNRWGLNGGSAAHAHRSVLGRGPGGPRRPEFTCNKMKEPPPTAANGLHTI